MCRMFAEQPQENYAYQTRSIRIGGHGTSVRLEAVFWTILEEIAASEGRSVANFVTTLHDEVLLEHGALNNLASLLRCSCLLYISSGRRGSPAREMTVGPAGARRGYLGAVPEDTLAAGVLTGLSG